MLTLYGNDMSSGSNKVKMVLHALDVPFTFEALDLLKGENRTDNFKAKSLVGKVPVIDDDGFLLFESDAIVKYLAKKAQSDLYPVDIKAQAIVDAWCSYVAVHLFMGLGRVKYNRILAPKLNQEVDENSLKAGLAFVRRCCKVFEARLAESPYIAGEDLTLADISLIATIDPVDLVSINLSSYPALFAYRKRLQQESFYQKAMVKEN